MRTCARCGRQFSSNSNERFCKTCAITLLRGDEKTQENIKNFVRDNRGVSEREVMEKFGVSKKFVRQMLSNKVVATGAGTKIHYPCANCGKIITEGVYCKECFILLRNQVQKQSMQMAYLQSLMSRGGFVQQYESTILVVDHDELALNVFKFILEKGLPKYKISVAGNLNGAMNVIHNYKVGLVLLDDTVSHAFDGMKILKSIREEPEMKEIPIVMMSAKADKKNISAGLSRGATDYISKPCEPNDLIERVKKNLGIEVEKAPQVENLNVDYESEAKYKILLVDDQEKDMQQEINILEDVFPCNITTAKNGIEALYMLSDPKFETDLVLVSLEMPFMDGFEFLAFVADDEYMRRFPVVIMTTSTNVNILSGIKKSFAKGYIRKPDISAEGLEMIAKILET